MENQQAMQSIYLGRSFWQTDSPNVVSGFLDVTALDNEEVQALMTEKNGRKSVRVKLCKRKDLGKHKSTHFLVVDLEYYENQKKNQGAQ
jgi:hypothetical protein